MNRAFHISMVLWLVVASYGYAKKEPTEFITIDPEEVLYFQLHLNRRESVVRMGDPSFDDREDDYHELFLEVLDGILIETGFDVPARLVKKEDRLPEGATYVAIYVSQWGMDEFSGIQARVTARLWRDKHKNKLGAYRENEGVFGRFSGNRRLPYSKELSIVMTKALGRMLGDLNQHFYDKPPLD